MSELTLDDRRSVVYKDSTVRSDDRPLTLRRSGATLAVLRAWAQLRRRSPFQGWRSCVLARALGSTL